MKRLPTWVNETLTAHDHDGRPLAAPDAEVAAGATGHVEWNAMQQQLVKYGELHPALRGMWGRKLLELSASAEQSLNRVAQLNDKFALDGCGPGGVWGALTALGLRDAKASRISGRAETSIYGTLPQISTGRLVSKTRSKDLQEYVKLPVKGSKGGYRSAWSSPAEKRMQQECADADWAFKVNVATALMRAVDDGYTL